MASGQQHPWGQMESVGDGSHASTMRDDSSRELCRGSSEGQGPGGPAGWTARTCPDPSCAEPGPTWGGICTCSGPAPAFLKTQASEEDPVAAAKFKTKTPLHRKFCAPSLGVPMPRTPTPPGRVLQHAGPGRGGQVWAGAPKAGSSWRIPHHLPFSSNYPWSMFLTITPGFVIWCICMCFYIYALYSFTNIKFTILKRTVPWHLVHS